MQLFVYTATKENRDALLLLGYTMITNDERNDVYIFRNDGSIVFSDCGVEAVVTSDVLMF